MESNLPSFFKVTEHARGKMLGAKNNKDFFFNCTESFRYKTEHRCNLARLSRVSPSAAQNKIV